MSIDDNNKKNNILKKQIESLLFVSGEPMSLNSLSKLLEINKDEVEKLVLELKDDFENSDRGLVIIEKEEKYQLATCPEASEIAEKFFKSEMKEELSQASLETLAIIAYKGPITRFEIDNIRGVNSSFILRSLLIRGLIEKEQDKKNKLAYAYKISLDMLKNMGLENIFQLPDYEKYNSCAETINQEADQQEEKTEEKIINDEE